MTMKLNISGRKRGESGQIRHPFVGQIVPFIGPIGPYVLPFVCKKQPLVTDYQNQRGFTLIELMITLVILGILSALAAPAMRDMVMNNRLATETNDMLVSLNFSRSEAIKRSTQVMLCKTLDPSTLPSSCDAGATWANGWVIFADENANGTFDDGTDIVLRFGDGFSGAGNQITPNPGTTNLFGFTRLGLLNTGAISFFICDSRGDDFARVIDISGTGRARINRTATPACV